MVVRKNKLLTSVIQITDFNASVPLVKGKWDGEGQNLGVVF